MRGYYEVSPAAKKRAAVKAKAATNPHGVAVGNVYRRWDPRERLVPDDKTSRYKVIDFTRDSSGAVCEKSGGYSYNGKPLPTTRVTIRLDRFSSRNYLKLFPRNPTASSV